MILGTPKPKKMRRVGGIRVYRGGREVCLPNQLGKQLYRQRTLAMAYRQKWRCALCGLLMTEETVSYDHEFGRGMSGSKREDRIEIDGKRINAAVHIICNGQKGSRRVPYLIQ